MIRAATRLLVGVLVLAGPAVWAADGVLEINQACAANTGCFTGDATGFPVRISAAGSYRLKSNLDPGTDDAIVVGSFVRVVTIDLNGFRIVGPGSGTGVGILGEASASAITVRNGTIQSMGGDGISIGGSSVVESVNLLSNLGDGVDVNATSIVRDGRIGGNGGYGIRFDGPQALYSGNMLFSNALGAVLGGSPGGVNLCDDAACSSSARRRYYLTTAIYNGVDADGANVCEPGFHFGNFFEMADPSNLEYEEALGLVFTEPGPPPLVIGWARSGLTSDPGINCEDWSVTTGTGLGVLAANPADFSDPALVSSPWQPALVSCASAFSVWCVED